MRMGKSEARARLLPLVESMAAGAAPIEITDRGKIAAVLLSYQDYLGLLARAGESPQQWGSLVGTMTLVGDLEEATREIAAQIQQSLERTAAEL